jgi:hypothetical protein
LNHAVAGENEWLDRASEKRRGRVHGVWRRIRKELVAREIELDVPRGHHARLLRVLRHIDEHGPRATRRGQVERLAHDAGNVARISDEVPVLRDRNRDPRDVRLLERIGAEQCARHLTSDSHERSRIHPRVRNRRHEVRCTWPARCDTHAHAPRGPRVTFRSVTGALFMTAQHMTQPVAILPHRVVERHDRAAGDAEHDLDPLSDERLAEDLRSAAQLGLVCHASTAPWLAFVTSRA